MFRADNVLLFCSSNNIVVDYPRKFVMDKHLEAESHKQNTEKNEGGKQQALKAFLNCKTTVVQIERVRICKAICRQFYCYCSRRIHVAASM